MVKTAPRDHGRTRFSVGMGVVSLAMAALYAGPDHWVRRPLPPDQTSVVVFLEERGPTWAVLFGLGAVLLLASPWVGNLASVAGHAVATLGFATYSTAVLVGALMTQPPTPVTVGVLALGLTFTHASLALSFADRPRMTPPGGRHRHEP